MPFSVYFNVCICAITNCSYHWQAIHVIARRAQTRTRLRLEYLYTLYVPCQNRQTGVDTMFYIVEVLVNR